MVFFYGDVGLGSFKLIIGLEDRNNRNLGQSHRDCMLENGNRIIENY